MIKFLLCIAIVAFTSLCGYLLAKKYRQKKNFFTQMVVFNERFLSELTYFRRPIHEFVFSYTYHDEFLQLLKDYSRANLKHNVNMHEILNDSTYSFLKNDEKKIVLNYFSMLGKADSAAQKTYFSSMKEILRSAEIGAITNYQKYGSLYIKIGFLIGLLILILII